MTDHTHSRSVRALVVDDDAALRRLVGATLRASGIDVVEAPDGVDALDVVGSCMSRTPPEPPDVDVTDVRMAGLTGLHVLAALRDLRPAIPTIVVTAFPDAPTRALATKLGATRLLEKPIDVDVIPGIIARCLGLARVHVVDNGGRALADTLARQGVIATWSTLESASAVIGPAAAVDAIVVAGIERSGAYARAHLVALRRRVPDVPLMLAAPSITSQVRELLGIRGSRYIPAPVDVSGFAIELSRLAREARRAG